MGKIEDPFVMKWILPEHATALFELSEDKKLVPKSILEEDELQEINFRIIDSIQYDYAVAIKWWKSTKGALGEYEQAWGWVKTVDHVTKRLKLVNDEDVWWIPMDKIVEVRES